MSRETLDQPGCVIARDITRFVRQIQRMLFRRVIETQSLHALPQISLGLTALWQSQAASGQLLEAAATADLELLIKDWDLTRVRSPDG